MYSERSIYGSHDLISESVGWIEDIPKSNMTDSSAHLEVS